MHKNQSLVELSLNEQVDELLTRFGGRQTLLALLGGLRRRRNFLNLTGGMSERMRRDAGLPVEEVDAFDRMIATVAAYRLLR